MNRRRKFLALLVAIPLVMTRRLPAPIIDESTPVPSKSTSAHKTAESTPPAASRSAQQFDGTWKGPYSQTYSGESLASQNVLVIEAGARRASLEVTLTRTSTDHWKDVPTEYSTTPLTFRWRFVSRDLKLDGSNLRIRWEAPQLIDWSPKAFSPAQIEEIKKTAAKNKKISIYTLRGNQLTREFDSQGGATYTRVK